jgi:hypothetical protein
MSDAVFVSEERDEQPRLAPSSEPVWSAHGWWTCGRHWGRCSVEASSPVRDAFYGHRMHRDPIRKGWWVAREGVRYVAVEGVPEGQRHAAADEELAPALVEAAHGNPDFAPAMLWTREADERWSVIDLHDLGPERAVVTTTSADIGCGRCKDIVGPRACGACGGVSDLGQRHVEPSWPNMVRLQLWTGLKPERCSSPDRGGPIAQFTLPLPHGGRATVAALSTSDGWHWRVYDDRGVCHVQGDPCDLGMRDHIAIGDRIIIDAASLVGGRGRIKGPQLSTAVRDAVMEEPRYEINLEWEERGGRIDPGSVKGHVRIEGPSDAEIVRAYEHAMRNGDVNGQTESVVVEGEWLKRCGIPARHIHVPMLEVRAAWSRELRRLVREAAERARIPVQSSELEDHEGQDVEDLSGLMDPFVRVWR